jgi:hypothetical protein
MRHALAVFHVQKRLSFDPVHSLVISICNLFGAEYSQGGV